MNLELAIGVIYLACAALLFIISVLVFREDSRKRINRVTAMMFAFAGFGPLFYGFGIFIGDAVASRSPVYNLVYIWELFFPQLVFFALVFPSEVRSYKRFPRLKYVIFVPHLFHLVLTTVFADPDKLVKLVDPKRFGTMGKAIFEPLEPIAIVLATFFSWLLDSHIKLFSIVNFVYVIIAAVILYYATKRVTTAQLVTQVRVVISGIIAALTMYVIAFILPAIGVIELSLAWQNVFTLLALIIGGGAIVWAIVKYRFMDVRLIVRQSLVYTLSSALVVGAYVLMIRQFEDVVKYFFGFDVPGLDIIFIIVALILFQPVMSQIDELIRRFFIRDKSDFRNISQTFSRKVASVFNLEEVFTLAHDVLKDQLLIEHVFIFVRDHKAGALSPVKTGLVLDCPELNVGPALQHELARRSGVNNIDELLGAFRDSEFLQTLAQRRVRFIAPLVSGEELLGCLAISDKVSGYRLNYEDVTTISTMADQLSLAINTSRLYRESIEKQRLEEEMNFARAIQLELLPKTFPAGANYHFAAFSDPSLEVGGDYFDFIHTSRGTVIVVIADASGKGMPAALLVSQIQAAIRTEIKHNTPLRQMLINVNELLQQEVLGDKFATLFLAEFDPDNRTLRYSNAGHNYPIIISDDATETELDQGGLLLGAFHGVDYEEGVVQLKPTDILFIYTDGLNEAYNGEDEQYGEDRAVAVIKKHRHLPAAEIQQYIVEDVRNFTAPKPLQDDMTLILLKVH